MTDPFSVAASAFGVVSFGIQTCSGILEYYSRWKEYDNDVAYTCQLIDDLQSLLKTTQSVLSSVQSDGIDAERDQAQRHIRNSEASILRLQQRFDKIKAGESTDATSSTQLAFTKWDRQRRKFLYPFRQGTLGKLRDAATEAHDLLALALQVLNM
jgi:hypothetical protein